MPVRIRDILLSVKPLAPDMNVIATWQRFVSEPQTLGLPVVLNDIPIGILLRSHLMELMAGPELKFEPTRVTVGQIVKETPAIAEVTLPAAFIAKKLADEAGHNLQEGVIAVEDGRYAGYVSPFDLLTAVAQENATRAKALKASFQKLDAMRQKSLEQRREQSQFMAFLGHEIRTPLTGILGIADLLDDRRLDPEAREYARTISQSGLHLDRLLSDFLDLSRLEVGKLDITPAPFKVRDFANEARALWLSGADKKDVVLKVTVDDHSAERVEADATRLRQVLFNLISNAIKFTEAGSITAHVSTSEVAREGLSLEMVVTDTGTGISDADKARLFEAFEQAAPQTVHRYGGTGLGLAISKALVERMGGTIRLEDNPEGGSIFKVTCPVQKAGPRLAVSNKRKQRSGNFKLGRILLVEDHAASRTVISKALGAAGWTVEEVETLAEARNRLFDIPYQAILTDLNLTDGSGLEIAKALGARPGPNQDIPLLAVTADVRETRRTQCKRFGFDDVIEKPVRPRDLVARLADVIMKAGQGEHKTLSYALRRRQVQNTG